MPYSFNVFTGNFDLVQDLSGYVPYTGATTNVDLGAHNLTANQGIFESVLINNLFLDENEITSVLTCLALNSADCIEFKSNNVLKGEVDSTGFHIGDHGVGTSTSVPLYIYDNYGASVKIQAVKMNYSAGYTLLTPDPTLAQESFTIVTSSAVNAAKKIAVFDDTYDVTSYADFQFNSATNTITIGGAGTQGSIGIVNGARTLTLRAPSSTYTLTFPPVPVGTTQTPQLATTGVMTTILNTGTGNNVLATSPTIVTPAITTSAVITRNNIAATPSYGLYMRNTTASTSGVPVQLSPAIELFGSGWDTDGSVSVGLNSQIYLGFLSGTTVHGQLRFDLNQSGGSSETRMWLNDTGELGLDGATNPQSILSIGGNGISGAGLFVGNTAYGYKQVVFSDGSGEELFSVSGDVGATTSLISLGDVNDAYSYARLDVTYDKAKLWNGNLEVVQDIISEAYITGKKSGIFAYLSASANTTITTAGTYYYINGSFTNSPIENFSLVADPAIRYDGTKTQHFETDWHATISADIANTTVTIGIKKNGTLVTSSLMSTFCKNVGELYNLSGTTVVELATNDKIQLVVTSDGSGDIITFNNFTTTINEFFD